LIYRTRFGRLTAPVEDITSFGVDWYEFHRRPQVCIP